jgi:hypothetical protein
MIYSLASLTEYFFSGGSSYISHTGGRGVFSISATRTRRYYSRNRDAPGALYPALNLATIELTIIRAPLALFVLQADFYVNKAYVALSTIRNAMEFNNGVHIFSKRVLMRSIPVRVRRHRHYHTVIFFTVHELPRWEYQVILFYA